jgi:hypothetical protein
MLKLLKKSKYPDWLKKANIENEIVYLDTDYNMIIWKGGTWKGGIWKGGIWEEGIWEEGIWEEGIWEYGIWEDGTWEYGTWKGGIWKGGIWEDGTWEYGTWEYGTWKGGTWKGGTWKGGIWEDGTWEGGMILFSARLPYEIYYNKTYIKIGCQLKTIEEWNKLIKNGQTEFNKHGITNDQYKEYLKIFKAIKILNNSK